MLQGEKLAGDNPKNDRVEYDFYATDSKAVEKLLLKYPINGDKILEPCVGNCTVDKDGKLVGITTFRLKDQSHNIIYGISYCIPVNTVMEYIKN